MGNVNEWCHFVGDSFCWGNFLLKYFSKYFVSKLSNSSHSKTRRETFFVVCLMTRNFTRDFDMKVCFGSKTETRKSLFSAPLCFHERFFQLWHEHDENSSSPQSKAKWMFSLIFTVFCIEEKGDVSRWSHNNFRLVFNSLSERDCLVEIYDLRRETSKLFLRVYFHFRERDIFGRVIK